MAKLSIIRGYPGQGKSTWAKKKFNCILLENDMFQYKDGKYCWSPKGAKDAIRRVLELTKDLLSDGIDVCVANTFTKARFVESYKRIAEEHGAAFEVFRMTKEYKNVHNVPKDVLKSMKENFEDYPGETFVE